jgi:hypothetical protein
MYYDALYEQTRKADEELLAQYEKELIDLENKKGLYDQMTVAEVEVAKRSLREHISLLETALA